MNILRIALPVPLPGLFDYLPPASGDARPGSRVLVPFGRKRLVGVVVACTDHAELAPERLRTVEALLDAEPLLDDELLQSLSWAADYWLGAPGEVFANALPLALREQIPTPSL
ncbi:primosome assembly protein, partial [Lasius niger]